MALNLKRYFSLFIFCNLISNMSKVLTQPNSNDLPWVAHFQSYNQGEKSLDRLSSFSSIHSFTALKFIFVDYEMEWSLKIIVVSICNSPFPPLSQCCAQ